MFWYIKSVPNVKILLSLGGVWKGYFQKTNLENLAGNLDHAVN